MPSSHEPHLRRGLDILATLADIYAATLRKARPIARRASKQPQRRYAGPLTGLHRAR